MSLNNWSEKKIIVEDTSAYMLGQDYDIVEEARGKKITDPLRAKLMGMEDIRSLKGTMTPRYFATKVIRYLQKENPELDVEDLSEEDIQKAINIVANVSKPLSTRSDIQITTREKGSAEKGLKKGDSGFETLQLNLGDDAILTSQGEVGDNDLYTIVKDGLKYRVTLNKFKGTKLNLDDIDKDDIVSVVIVKPSEKETVDKFGGEIELGQREKLVADFPEGEEDDYPGNVFDQVRRDPREFFDPDIPIPVSDYSSEEDAEHDEDAEIDKEKADLNDDGELSEYEKVRGQAIADAMEKSSEKDDSDEDEDAEHEEDAERCPVTGKLRKKSDEEKEEESSCDEEEDNEEIALSPQQINQMMRERGRQEMHRHHQIERLFRHGY